MANKKIVVLKLRELIYTGIFLFFGIILILLLVTMFRKDRPEGDEPAAPTMTSTAALLPGLYTTELQMADNAFTLELRVQSDISSTLQLIPASTPSEDISGEDYLATMYPLVEPALDILSRHLTEGAPLSEVTFSLENQYTGTLLLDALELLLTKATTPEAGSAPNP